MPSFEGLHDITMTELPPRRKPYLIMAPEDRIGTTSIPVDPEKIVAIIESDYQDQTQPNSAEDDTSRAIAGHLIEFLEHEVKHDRLPPNLLPIQSGIGNIANAVIGGLATSKFQNLKVWTEVLQDTFLDLFDSGKLDFATATSIRFSPEGFKRFYDGWEQYYNKLLLRSPPTRCYWYEHSSRSRHLCPRKLHLCHGFSNAEWSWRFSRFPPIFKI
jgi:acetyl-CoA hydrolase